MIMSDTRETIKKIVRRRLSKKDAGLSTLLADLRRKAEPFLQLNLDYYNNTGTLQNLLDDEIPKESAVNIKQLQTILNEIMQYGIDNNLGLEDADYVDSKYYMNELSEAMDAYRELLQVVASIRPELDKLVAALAKVTGQS